MEKITDELAQKVYAWIESEDVQSTIKDTKNASETGSFEVIITTENLDRYQEVISLEGWDLEHYRANPVVLWGHDHFTLPIGVCTDLEVRDGKLIARGKFAPHEHAQNIRRLYDLGIVRATSVGFIEKEREGNLITKAELLEFSFVSVPANPYALKLDTLGLEEVSTLVTKGILNLKDIKDNQKDTENVPEEDAETKPEEEVEKETTPEETGSESEESEPEGTEETRDEPELTDDEKRLADHIAKTVIASLKAEHSALEDTNGEPEGTEAPEADEDEKGLDDFSEKRRIVQEAATIFGDVLAEARQAIEAKK